MPLYEYKCVKCGHHFDKIENVKSSETKKCPKCGAKAERQITAAAIQFKGSGWYVTDYASKKSAPGSSEASGSNEKSSAGDKSASSDKPASNEKSGDSKSPKQEQKLSESKTSSEKESSKKKK